MSGASESYGNGSWPLADALAAGDSRAAARVLAGAQVAVPVVNLEDRRTVGVASNEAGRRVLLAFSNPDSVLRWNVSAEVRVVEGRELPRIADEQHVDAVLFDVSGPAPYELGLRVLQSMVDGIAADADGATFSASEMRVRAAGPDADPIASAIRRAELPAGSSVLLFERQGGTGAILTVGVTGTAESARQVTDLVRSDTPAGVTVDVLVLDQPTREAIEQQLPDSVIV